jgi:4-oxalocrotonate tautomerase
MPFVNVKMVKSGKGPDEKEKLIAGITQLLGDLYDKPAEVCHVLIEEFEPEAWGWQGGSIAKLRAGK